MVGAGFKPAPTKAFCDYRVERRNLALQCVMYLYQYRATILLSPRVLRQFQTRSYSF